MRLKHDLHLAYCTNIHRGETWPEIFAALNEHTLQVRAQVAPNSSYAIGLRLGERAVRDLQQAGEIMAFRRWLDKHDCYIFTINGFPYGRFHGTRVKEQVYAPDWTTTERVEYTVALFEILVQLLPDGIEGSVSTVPCSYKEFITTTAQAARLRENIWACIEAVAGISERTGKKLHLGLEPEPLCYLETSEETASFFDQLRSEHPRDTRLREHLGVNYDNCHLAVEFEEPRDVIRRFKEHDIKISKLHFSSALKVIPTPEVREALRAFAEDVYFHQVIERAPGGQLKRYKDLDIALATPQADPNNYPEWRIHFHIPLHCEPRKLFQTTADHILGVMDVLSAEPRLCSHIEMETYTWEVLPSEIKKRNVVDQLVSEYGWTLTQLAKRGLADPPSFPAGVSQS
jgi:sugar phosphate isomerase/epimerase